MSEAAETGRYLAYQLPAGPVVLTRQPWPITCSCCSKDELYSLCPGVVQTGAAALPWQTSPHTGTKLCMLCIDILESPPPMCPYGYVCCSLICYACCSRHGTAGHVRTFCSPMLSADCHDAAQLCCSLNHKPPSAAGPCQPCCRPPDPVRTCCSFTFTSHCPAGSVQPVA